MAVGIYTLPICDGCKLPWLPVGWTQDSDPRNPDKPLRCGKCKSIGWDREFVKQQKAEATETALNPFDPAKTIEMPRNVDLTEALDRGFTPASEDDPKVIKGLMQEAEAHNGSRTPVVVTVVSVEDEVVAEIRKIHPARCKHRMTDCPICHPKEAA